MYGNPSEPVTLEREVRAVVIPAGDVVNLPAGTLGYITQSLGGSFSVYVDGHLFRVAGEDADALGKEPVPPIELPPEATDGDFEQVVWDQMRTCYDPEIPINIVDLGLIYTCDIEKLDDERRQVSVKMTLTAPGCGMGEILVQDVQEKIEHIPTVAQVDVELVFDPPWNQSMMSDAAKLQTGMF